VVIVTLFIRLCI